MSNDEIKEFISSSNISETIDEEFKLMIVEGLKHIHLRRPFIALKLNDTSPNIGSDSSGVNVKSVSNVNLSLLALDGSDGGTVLAQYNLKSRNSLIRYIDNTVPWKCFKLTSAGQTDDGSILFETDEYVTLKLNGADLCFYRDDLVMECSDDDNWLVCSAITIDKRILSPDECKELLITNADDLISLGQFGFIEITNK